MRLCKKCSFFAPARGAALLRALGLGWCFKPECLYKGLRRSGHAPFRAAWAPGCRELTLKDTAPRSGAGGQPCDFCRGFERRSSASTADPEGTGPGARSEPSTPKLRAVIFCLVEPEAHAKPLQSGDAAAGPAQREGRIGDDARASNGAPEAETPEGEEGRPCTRN